MTRILLFTLLVLSCSLSAIVIRHDVDDSKYRVQTTEFPALADMPGEGHGVLIAPQWVITALNFAGLTTKSAVLMAAGFVMCSTTQRMLCSLKADRVVEAAAGQC